MSIDIYLITIFIYLFVVFIYLFIQKGKYLSFKKGFR